MNRRALILSILAVGAAGFGGAAWYVTRPAPMAAAPTLPIVCPGEEMTRFAIFFA